jgi:MHS family proline/betaine transporter-like MFS transporter
MKQLIDPSIDGAFWVNALALFFGLVMTLPLAGILSDHCGRLKVMLVGAVLLGGLGPIMLWVISWGNAYKAFFAQWAIGVSLSIFGGFVSVYIFLVDALY